MWECVGERCERGVAAGQLADQWLSDLTCMWGVFHPKVSFVRSDFYFPVFKRQMITMFFLANDPLYCNNATYDLFTHSMSLYKHSAQICTEALDQEQTPLTTLATMITRTSMHYRGNGGLANLASLVPEVLDE